MANQIKTLELKANKKKLKLGNSSLLCQNNAMNFF